jgi:hypothetical protein
MVFLQGLLSMLLRQAGRLLNTAFGWATTLLFGKVPEKRQLYLSGIGLGSVLWLVVVVGIAFPAVGTFLLAFIPLPDWVNDNWIRLAMLGLAVLIPPLVGFISLFLVDPQDRPKGSDRIKAILKGYPYTVGLALTLVMLLFIAPIVKIRDLARRWTSEHVPVIVESKDYFTVVGELQRVLREGGIETSRERAGLLLRLPTRVFTFFVSGSTEDLVAKELTTLRGENIEVLLHPSDLVISGREKDVLRARAIISEHMTFTKGYLTWSKEANEMEDRITSIVKEITPSSARAEQTRLLGRLEALEHELKQLELQHEEWEVLFRELLLAEREVLQQLAGVPTQEMSPENGRRQPEPVAGGKTTSAKR